MSALSSAQTRGLPAMPVQSASAGFLASLAARVSAVLRGSRPAVIGLMAVLALAGSAESAAAIWDLTETNCQNCHGATPGTIRPAVLNAANVGSIISHANTLGMGGTAAGGVALTPAQITALATYIAGFTTNPNPANVPVAYAATTGGITIPQIYLNSTYGAFNKLVFDSATNGGSVAFTNPGGPSVNGTASYTALACRTGPDTITYHAEGTPGNNSNSRTFTVSIGAPPAPTVNSSATPAATTETAFTYDITVTAASCPGLVTSYAAAGLPAWLAIDTTNGKITGTPPLATADTVVNFSVTASIGAATSLSYPVALAISLGAPSINSPTPAPSGKAGTVYPGYKVTATNAPTSFSVAPGVAPNILPPGLSLDPVTGQVTGLPTVAGTFTPTIRATNAVPLTGGSVITFVINAAVPPDVTGSPATANGQTGILFNYQIIATNSPTGYSAAGLPPGVNQPTATGLITGTPTAVGIFAATVTATNFAGPASRAVTITITLGPPVITSPNSAGGSTGFPFSYQITATNNPSSFSAIGLPPGLAVNPATGAISGTPTTIGVFNATVSATNAVPATTSLAVTFTIDSGNPVITSAATATGTTLEPFAYQITATNSPSSFGATGLPPGLAVDTSTGRITGTPTTVGTYKVKVSATNPVATAALEVIFTIGALAPTAQDLTIEVQFGAATPIKLPLSGQFTQVAIVSGPSHGTVAIPPPNSATVVYTPSKNYSGPDSFTYNATGPGGTSQPAQVKITVPERAPIAQPAALTVPLNTPTTIDLLAFITGSGLTGVAISVDASHGITEVNGTRVTYTPKQNYFGPDSFTYRAFGSLGTSPPAIVTVTVIGRPDPTQDANVVGLLGAQAQVAQRFARAQVSNIQRRMESLHRDPPNSAAVAPAPGRSPGTSSRPVAGEPGRAPGATPDTGERQAWGADDVTREPQASANGFMRAGGPPADPGPRAAATGASGLLPASFVTSIISMAQSGTVNLANSTERGAPTAGVASGLGLWIGGSASFGTRNSSENRAGSRFSTDGITVGGDWRSSDALVFGMGLGYAKDDTDFGNDGTKMKSDGSSIAAYASYQPTRSTFVDALLGYGRLNFDTDRHVSSVDQFAVADRKGTQIFASLAGGYEYRHDGLLLSPYGRLDFTYDKLKQATETGAGANALTYLDQTQRTFQFSLGARAESQHTTDFGLLRPRARAEYRHDFSGGSDATISYADQFAGLNYSVAPTGAKSNFLVLGVGGDLIFRSGARVGLDYQWQSSGGADSGQAIRLLLSQELDGKGWPSAPWTSRPLTDAVRVEAGFTFDDNVTRGRVDEEILSDRIYSLNLSSSRNFSIDANTRTVVTGLVNGEMFHRYTGLAHLSGGLQAEAQYRGSADFDAVTFAAFARGWLDRYQSHLRDGVRYSVGVSARRSLTDRIDVFGEMSGNWRRAESAVWDLADFAARLSFDYSLGRSGAFYVTGEFHRGDTVSSGRPSLENLRVAEVFVADDAFPGDGLFAYRFEAKTWVGMLGYNFPLGPRDSIDFSWRHVRSTPTTQLSFESTDSLRYVDNQYSVVYLLRF